MPPTPQPDKDDAHQRLLDQMDIYYTNKPFRNPDWKPSARRNKNIKQIVSEAQRREASVMATQNNSGASTPQPVPSDGTATPQPNMAQATQSLSTLVLERNLQKATGGNMPSNGLGQLGGPGPAVTYTNIESAPSLQTKKHYCDITGLPAKYTDPKTKLRYHNIEVFGVVRALPQGVPDQYLAARGANRIKGAIDDRIKEEQARQAKAQQTTKPPPRRRPQAADGSPARLSSRQRDVSATPAGKNPDPAEFAIGDEESASQVSTPQPQQESTASTDSQPPEKSQNEESKEDGVAGSSEPSQKIETSEKPAVTLQDLPVEVKAKLRKLDKLESKYAELLKAYRAAHARVQTIEPFEATLRESTPLTSISDPSALSEYLTQLNTKSGMVLDELKRVSVERDDFKKKSDSLQAENKQLESDKQDLQKQIEAKTVSDPPAEPATEIKEQTPKEDTAAAAASPKSVASRIPSISLFSPKSKPKVEEPKDAETSEDLFSFDSEVPKLEAQLAESQEQIESLNSQVSRLQNDLKVARESTEGMVETLESRTQEVNNLRDEKEKFETLEKELKSRITTLETEQASAAEAKADTTEIDDLKKELDQAKTHLQEAEEKLKALESESQVLKLKLESANSEMETLNHDLTEKSQSIAALQEKVDQKDSINKDLEDSLAFAKKAEREQEKLTKDFELSERRSQTMQGVIENLKAQLAEVEKTAAEKPVIAAPQAAAEPAIQDQPTTAAKKKNKKKKKGKSTGNVLADVEAEEPADGASSPPMAERSVAPVNEEAESKITALNTKIAELETELEDKKSTIDRLSAKIKDQEALQEEIETLRDDLLHQGEEHVEARDALKQAQAEQQRLQGLVDQLEKDLSAAQKEAKQSQEIVDAQKQVQADLDAKTKAHQEATDELESTKSRVTQLQADLSAAEQLATSRFKDITDLKDVLGKAQPELRSLRAEVEELKNVKEELRNKSGELTRLESKHEEVKSELKNLGKRLSTQDEEIRKLQSKVETETKLREHAEGEIQARDSELRSAESKRISVVEMHESAKADLVKNRKEMQELQSRLRDLSEQLTSHERQVSSLKEEVTLKAALHSSSQTLVQSLRDQIHELNVQTREATGRSESMEEELAEAQRMLSERTREGQTMRMLLNQAESGTEARLREMRERMEAALEERDRLEDENNVSSRRMAREVEEAKNKAREAQRQLKTLETEKDELELRSREWRKLREDLEYSSKAAEREAEETRNAMSSLREALDESERQIRELDAQRADTRRQLTEAVERVEKLSKANKNLTDEIKSLQLRNGVRSATARPGMESGLQSSRTSIDSVSARSPAPPASRAGLSSTTSLPRSETPTGSTTGSGLSQGTVDYVYLKNVLLQFLSQKDKGHQRQLIPVLGMLLHFDDKDQQRWNAAISAR